MRFIYTLSVLALLCWGCGGPAPTDVSDAVKKERQNYILTVTQSEVKPAESVKPGADEVCIAVPVSLENKSAAELKYYGMSCGGNGTEIYTIDNKKVKLMEAVCEKNTPMQFTITPRVQLGTELIVCVRKADGPQKFKVGMTLHAQAEDFGNTGIDKLLAQPGALLWSNEVTTP